MSSMSNMSKPGSQSPSPQPSATGTGIDAATVARVAQLARLGLDAAELARTAAQLDTILQHFRALQGVDTTGVEPLVHALDSSGEPAADVIAPFPQPRATLLSLTEHAREGFFVVPAVLDTDFGDDDKPARPAAIDLSPEDDPGADG
jgi:aspartyl-tRNA(Asn)/glutamyl-tRNA(Gln) amidotransferase subunit C